MTETKKGFTSMGEQPRRKYEKKEFEPRLKDLAVERLKVAAESGELDLLRKYEWSDVAVDGTGMAMHLQSQGPLRYCCPVCKHFKIDGHSEECWLREALGVPPNQRAKL
jgi:hypothetical protein